VPTTSELRHLGTPVGVRTGCSLITEGRPGRDVFLVVEGHARVTRDGRVIGHVGPGDFVGELALIDHGPREASVTATTPMQVVAFDAPGFAALLDDPLVAREVRRQLVARLRAAMNTNSNPTSHVHNRRNPS
jgi:CRP-like cAMP-binding protein